LSQTTILILYILFCPSNFLSFSAGLDKQFTQEIVFALRHETEFASYLSTRL